MPKNRQTKRTRRSPPVPPSPATSASAQPPALASSSGRLAPRMKPGAVRRSLPVVSNPVQVVVWTQDVGPPETITIYPETDSNFRLADTTYSSAQGVEMGNTVQRGCKYLSCTTVRLHVWAFLCHKFPVLILQKPDGYQNDLVIALDALKAWSSPLAQQRWALCYCNTSLIVAPPEGRRRPKDGQSTEQKIKANRHHLSYMSSSAPPDSQFDKDEYFPDDKDDEDEEPGGAASRSAAYTLTEEHSTFLKTFIPRYHDMERAIVADKTAKTKKYMKGSKKEWIVANPCAELIKKFNLSDTNNLSAVRPAVNRFFYNKTCIKNGGATLPNNKGTAAPKPAAKTGISMFSDDATRKPGIDKKALELTPEHLRKKRGENLPYWTQARQALWDALTAEEQEGYDAAAKARNAVRDKGPPKEEIFTNQAHILEHVAAAVLHGAGVYRDDSDELQTFTFSIQEADRASPFKARLPDYEDFRSRLLLWGEDVLPAVEGERCMVEMGDSGPLLPPWKDDFNSGDARRLLSQFADKLYVWFDKPVPEERVIRMTCKGKEDSAPEEFRPATMDGLALTALYGRLIADQKSPDEQKLNFYCLTPSKAKTTKPEDGPKSKKRKDQEPVKARRTDYALIRHDATGGTPSAPASPTTSTPSSRSVSPVSSIHDEVGQGGKRKADDAADPEAKRKKVKPSKKAQEGVVPTAAARKAGRPPKKAGDTATAVAGPPPVKRGRGRPKRTDTGSTTTPAAAAPPNASVPKPKKRKQSDDNADGPPAKKQKQQPVAPAPAPTGRGTRSRGGPRAPSPTVPGRMIGAHFYPQGTRLPDGYSWQDTFAVVHEKEKRVRNEHYLERELTSLCDRRSLAAEDGMGWEIG
ncbi:hypothetical protein B0H11DRAFT_2418146 [Mycena galericulata]|nr:hypothetical protein B0H11DRAFT_2418146 [Mycena galericulata]